MKTWLVACTLFVSSYLLADPSLTETKTIHSKAPTFQGLLLIGNENDLPPEGYDSFKGVMAYHINLPANDAYLENALKPLLNTPLSKEVLLEIKKTVIIFYQTHKRPVVTVSIPEQDISHGVVRMLVKEGTLGKLTVSGNRWSNEDAIKKEINLKPGEVVASNILSKDLNWLNQNPFRRVDAIFFPGEEKETTDIELQVVDRFPLRVYGGIDNTGNDVTGNNRLYTGFNWGNLFNTNQSLSFQFISASEFNRFHAYTLFYEAPLPWRHLLSIYGGFSKVDAEFPVPNIIDTQFRTHGFSLQTSLRYLIPLQPMRAFLHTIAWGFDFKRTNNNLDFGGRPVISQDNVNLTQLMLSYHLGYTIDPLKITFDIEGFWSPGKWIADQTHADYTSLRPFSKVQYVYTRGAFTLIWNYFKEWSLRSFFRGQWASINLLPSEEYGIGGFDTVRGYKERIVNGDNVFIWNLEMHTPSISLLNPLSERKKFNDTFSALIFFDYGLSSVKKTVPNQEKTTFLASIGPGIRYTITPYVNLRVDWGFQLHNLHLGGPYQRLNFSLVVGY